MEYFPNVAIIIIICLLFYIVLKSNKEKQKIGVAIKLQEQANQHLVLIANEIRRSNQFLAELVGVDSAEYAMPVADVPSTPTKASRSTATTNVPVNQPVPFVPAVVSTNDPALQAKVYVGNIDYAATEAELGEYFSQYGQVESVNIPVNRYTGKARGFGFVTFASQQEAEQAMILNGSEFKGRQIQVNFAKERENV